MFYFTVEHDENLDNHVLLIVSKAFFDAEGYIEDRHITDDIEAAGIVLPDWLNEEGESFFVAYDDGEMTTDTIRVDLEAIGLVYKADLNA